MAKVNVNGLNDLAKRLNSKIVIEINKIFSNKNIIKIIAEIIVTDIKNNYERIQGPSKSTIFQRIYLEKYNNTDKAYRRSKIKAVFTGELLEDLKNNIKGSPTEKKFILEHSDKLHSKYLGKSGLIGNNISYKNLSKILVNDLGINYFALTDKAKREINNIIKNEIRKLLTQLK